MNDHTDLDAPGAEDDPMLAAAGARLRRHSSSMSASAIEAAVWRRRTRRTGALAGASLVAVALLGGLLFQQRVAGSAADPATDGRIVHTDLHYGNVLAADREPWLVIDPKPLSGDPHHEVAPLLWNRWDEIVHTGDVRGAVRARFHTVVDTAMLDEDRARDWVVVRVVVNVLWRLEALQQPGAQRWGAADDDLATRWLAIAKAVQQ